MIELTLIRKEFTENSTLGELHFDGKKFCDTLEPTQREGQPKIYGRTAIPKGRYQLVWMYSKRFNKCAWFLKNVPNFEGVLIHVGNTHEDTKGCILVGKRQEPDLIIHSKLSLHDLECAIHEKGMAEYDYYYNKVYLTIK